jgi:D-psicose/D-tagatose/L-ribulose 3-epimerase
VKPVPWRLSVSEWVLGERTLAQAIEAAAAAGLNGIEITARSSLDLAAARRALDAAGIAVSGISPGYSPDRDFADEGVTVRARAVAHLRRCVDMARELAAPVVVVVPSDRAQTAGAHERRGGLERAADAIRDGMSDLGADGPVIAIEPLNRYETHLVRTVAEAAELRERIGHPAAGIMADTFHMNIEEDTVTAALAGHGDKLVHVDLADNQRREPGSGHVDFVAFLGALSELGYQGWLNMECLPADVHALRRGRRYLEGITRILPDLTTQRLPSDV